MFPQVKEALSRKNLKCVSNFSPNSRGGAAIIFPKTWKVRESWALEPRSLYMMLEDEQGFVHSFMVSHFHHEASLRKKQWPDIAMAPRSSIAPNTISLRDHNSVLMPTRDVANSKAATDLLAALDARKEEASTLMRFGLVDAYACAHSGRATDHDPHGWTWGFP